MPVAQTRLECLQILRLIQCIRQRDWTQVEKLVANGVPDIINYTDPAEGDMPISVAAVSDDQEMVGHLLRLGAKADAVDSKGRTAVMRAAQMGNYGCVELLAKTRANLRIGDSDGKGALFYCMQPTEKHEQCAQLLIKYGADVNNCDNKGTPLLLFACERAAELDNFCLMLLNNGADPNNDDKRTNRTALMAAASSGNKEVVKALIEKGAMVNNVMNVSKIHAVHGAAKEGHIAILQMLSGAGAKFDIMDAHKNTPIHLAALGGHGECCRFLAQRGCDPKVKNDKGYTARMIAKEEGSKSTVRDCRRAERIFQKLGTAERCSVGLYDFCCLKKEELMAKFHTMDGDETGKMMTEDLVDILRETGAPLPERKDLEKLISSHGQDTKIDYELFLSGRKFVGKSFRISAFNKKKNKKKGKKKRRKRARKGKTKVPLPICTHHETERKENGGPPGPYVLRQVPQSTDQFFVPRKHALQDDSKWYCQTTDREFMNLNDVIRHWDVDSLKAALQNGSEVVYWRDKFYKTPLMVAANEGHFGLVSYLIEKGADVNATDNFKWTALHFACRKGHFEVVQLLLKHGAKVNAVTLNGGTPIMRAIESGIPDVIHILIDHGAELRVETRKGKNPLDRAAAFGDPRVFDAVKTKWQSLPPLVDQTKVRTKQSTAKAKT